MKTEAVFTIFVLLIGIIFGFIAGHYQGRDSVYTKIIDNTEILVTSGALPTTGGKHVATN